MQILSTSDFFRSSARVVTLQLTLDRESEGGGEIYADLSLTDEIFVRRTVFVRLGDAVRGRLGFLCCLAKTSCRRGQPTSRDQQPAIFE